MKLFIIICPFVLCYIHNVFGIGEDFSLLWQTRGMKNNTDFCDLLDMDYDACTQMLSATTDPGQDGDKVVVSGGSSEIAMFDPCNPRESTVVIPRHPDNDITVWPTCTRAMRCGGCCTSDVFSCEPTEIRTKYVKVFDTRLPYPGAHRFQFLGVRSIKIEEHVQCDAQCKTKPHECHKYQIYESRKCRCVCHPERLSLMHTCNKEQIWDDTECDCICPNRNTVNCPVPSYFSTTTCKCTLKTEVTGEIDLDLLFAKLGSKGFLDLNLVGNEWRTDTDDDDVTIGDGEGLVNATETSNSTTTPSGEETGGEEGSTTSSTTSTTESTTSTTTTTTTPKPTTPKRNPCAHVKCFGSWKARQLSNKRCQCMPPVGK